MKSDQEFRSWLRVRLKGIASRTRKPLNDPGPRSTPKELVNELRQLVDEANLRVITQNLNGPSTTN